MWLCLQIQAAPLADVITSEALRKRFFKPLAEKVKMLENMPVGDLDVLNMARESKDANFDIHKNRFTETVKVIRAREGLRNVAGELVEDTVKNDLRKSLRDGLLRKGTLRGFQREKQAEKARQEEKERAEWNNFKESEEGRKELESARTLCDAAVPRAKETLRRKFGVDYFQKLDEKSDKIAERVAKRTTQNVDTK